ncbi:MAG: hypothetical protein VYC11_04615, partial [Candidatus Thermoplasmatota archaeon]|nr:hypothetical protein [Candidatus Thermoplasmatota archaeon]
MSNYSIENLKPETSLCSLEIKGDIAHLTLTREAVFNALNIELISEIISILDWTKDRSVGERGVLTDETGLPYLRILVLS